MKCSFLNENFVLLRCSSWTNNNFACIESPGCMDIKMLLDHSPAHLNVFKLETEFDSLYPKYLYFSILEDEERRPRFFSLKREYFYRFTDRNKICFYKLAGFLTKDFTGVSCFLKENGKWNKYISNQKVEERRLIRVPFAAVFEKFAEYRRNPSERIKN